MKGQRMDISNQEIADILRRQAKHLEQAACNVMGNDTQRAEASKVMVLVGTQLIGAANQLQARKDKNNG